MSVRAVIMLVCLLLVPWPVLAAVVSVQSPESPSHGFLVLRSATGETLAHGEMIQTVKDDRVDNRLTFRFKDGSLYDETVVFSQRRVFRLLSYRMIQRGPSFPTTQDVSFDRAGERYRARVGDETIEGRLDLPADVYNGMASLLLKNLPRGAGGEAQLLAFTPKPRRLKMALSAEDEDRFYVGDAERKATRYLVKLELGGVTGVVASALGKDPPDLRYWMAAGPVPAFLKFEGPMYLNGPHWRVELAAPRWPKAPVSQR